MSATQITLLELAGLAVALLLAVWSWRKYAATLPHPPAAPITAPAETPEGELNRVWVVYNPMKAAKYPNFFARLESLCLLHTDQSPKWAATTEDDPGTGQAVEALKWQPQLIVAAGGDGTVRAVAAGVAHSGVPMGILPLGTGNLFARNLDLPLDLGAAFERALTGEPHRVDLAWLRLEEVSEPSQLPAEGWLLQRARRASAHRESAHRAPPQQETANPTAVSADEYAYLVIAGVGFDGRTMEDTNPQLKRRVGWSAYVLASFRHLLGTRVQARLTIHDPVALEETFSRAPNLWPAKLKENLMASQTIGANTGLRARTVLFANCGSLPFAKLAPDAAVDDGLLDVIAVDTQGGLFGWANLAVKVFSQGIGLRAVNSKHSLGRIAFRQGTGASVELCRPETVEVDGDPIGSARKIFARVDPGALLIKH